MPSEQHVFATTAPCNSNCNTTFYPRTNSSTLCKRKGWPGRCQTYPDTRDQSIQTVTDLLGCDQTYFNPLTTLLDAELDADFSLVVIFVFKLDITFSYPTKQLTGCRTPVCHIQHTGSLWLSDNNRLETRDVLKAQIAASQQMGLC